MTWPSRSFLPLTSFALSSEYVAVRDGTMLAVDLYRPKDKDGKVVEDKLPVLWMHTPYNRRYFSYGGMRALSVVMSEEKAPPVEL